MFTETNGVYKNLEMRENFAVYTILCSPYIFIGIFQILLRVSITKSESYDTEVVNWRLFPHFR